MLKSYNIAYITVNTVKFPLTIIMKLTNNHPLRNILKILQVPAHSS